MTTAQLNAFKEISQNGEQFRACDLNISRRTVVSMAKRGWIDVDGEKAFITTEGHNAITAAGY